MLFVAFILTTFVFGSQGIGIHQYEELQHEHHEPVHKKPPIPIIKQSFEQNHHGFKHSFETANGIHAQEYGFIKNKGDKEHETLVQQGKITYHDEHGHPITLTYIADENGFQPQGNHLPTPPPVPEEIQKSLHSNTLPEHQEIYHQVPETQEVYEQQQEYGSY